MKRMDKGDVAKYIATNTVGKIVDIKEENGKVWAKLDTSKLYYVIDTLQPADPSEYHPVSFKEKKVKEFDGLQKIRDLHEMEESVDTSDMTPSGGG